MNRWVSIALVGALLVTSCGPQREARERQTAQTFALEAFEKMRARELRKLPLATFYDESKIQAVEGTASLIPREQPSSVQVTAVELAGWNTALVRTVYGYADRKVEVAVGMERSSEISPWRFYALSVNPA